MASSAILVIFISAAAALLQILPVSSIGGFSAELIHRDSPISPFYDLKSTPFSRFLGAAERSRSRANYFGDAIRKAAISPSATKFHSDIISNTSGYLMSFYLGTPDNQIIAIADTGSDLLWVNCVPCAECHNQSHIFDPQASSTYKTIPCSDETCPIHWRSNCKSSSQCLYHYAYGDGSLVEGFLSTETIRFESGDTGSAKFPGILFGCTHQRNGSFDKLDVAGLVGLGGGKLSLIRQLGSAIDSRFSYCLPSITSATSRLNFGSEAIISASNAVTTTLIPGSPDTFYFLSLEQIIVADQAIIIGKPKHANASARGNIIIDSGTTLTLIDENALQSVENKLKENVSLPQVKDPNRIFSLCFNVSGVGASSIFPDITFQFSGNARMVLPSQNTFVEATENTACLAIVSIKAFGENISILGNIAQQNFHISYDLGAMTLTFAPTNCASL